MVWHRTGSNSETLVYLITSAPLPPEATLGMSLFFLMSSLPSLTFSFLFKGPGEFPRSPAAGTLYFHCQGPRFDSLVRELGSHRSCHVAKK